MFLYFTGKQCLFEKRKVLRADGGDKNPSSHAADMFPHPTFFSLLRLMENIGEESMRMHGEKHTENF